MKRDLEGAAQAAEPTIAVPAGLFFSMVGRLLLPGSMVLNVSGPAPAQEAGRAALPKIGEQGKGGIYAGLSVEDERPVALVLLPGDESMPWKEACEWAGKQGGVLPSRFDQLVLFKNLKSEFQSAWYWSGEQFAGYGAYAWSQGFGYGGQRYGHKGDSYRARAVRRLPIQ